MRIDPELRALRSDPAPQRHAQAALEGALAQWRSQPEVAEMLEGVRMYGEGAALTDCPALMPLVTSGEGAGRLVAGLVDTMIETLVLHPLGHVPLRHQYSEGLGVLQLAVSGNAALSLLIYEETPATMVAPASLCFSDGERHEIVLAGKADIARMRIIADHGDRAEFQREPFQLTTGDTLHVAGPAEAKLVERIHGRLVVLRIARTPERAQPSREFRLADGALLHRASGDRRESRHEMMMAVLGRMRRQDAAPVFAEMTRHGSEHLRWQALRECIALDVATGFAALSTITRDPGDVLHGPAASLRAQLLAAHPQLAELESAPCPA